MLFNSVEYLIFLPVVFVVFWFALRRTCTGQNLFLLAASYVFYGWWSPAFLGLIVASSLTDYVIGRWLDATDDRRGRRLLVAASLLVNLSILGFFKYYNFFAENLVAAAASAGIGLDLRTLEIILPVGVSFYTFQTLSYTLDIYARRLSARRNPLTVFVFVAFFPQLVAGPIERARNLLPQFERPRSFDAPAATDGMRQILWGVFKKVVVADTLAPHVDFIFTNASTLPPATLALGAFYFAFQIYGDFSGYSDIAIGSARLLGFNLTRNFAFPYFSRDIGEFWRRWHISLSSWFRDYLYIPLGGSRVSRGRVLRNVIIVFVVSGLWHGANWTFIVWGLLHAMYFIPLLIRGANRRHLGDIAAGRWWPTAGESLSILATFVFTCLAWVFFRAETLGDAVSYLRGMIPNGTWTWPLERSGPLVWILVLLSIEWCGRSREHGLDIGSLPRTLRWTIYLALVFCLLSFGAWDDANAFIYFQF